MAEYYRLSGKVSPIYFLYWLLGTAAVAVTSVAYAIIMFYMPIIYLNFLITLGYGALIGLCAAFIAKYGKLRNPVIWALTVLIFFAIFTYVHLTAYSAVVFKDVTPVIDPGWFFYFLVRPVELFVEVYPIIVSEGVWSIRRMDTAVSGIPLLLIWFVEHCIVLFAAFSSSKSAILDRPFFEETGHWGLEHIIKFAWDYLPTSTVGPAREALEHGDADFFCSLPALIGDSACVLSYYTDLGEDSDKVYLSMRNVKVTVNKKGKQNKSTSYIVKNMLSTQRFVESLTAAAQKSIANAASEQTQER